MTEEYPEGQAFAFLSDLRKRFIRDNDFDKIASLHAYELKEFEPAMQELMVKLSLTKQHYNSNPKLTKTGEIIKDLQEAKNVIVENIEKLIDRDERLNIIAHKSDKLNKASEQVYYKSAKIKKQEKMKQMKMMMILGGGIAVRKN